MVFTLNETFVFTILGLIVAAAFIVHFAILIDVSRSKFKTDGERMGWTLLVFLAGPIGDVVWLCVGRKTRIVEENG